MKVGDKEILKINNHTYNIVKLGDDNRYVITDVIDDIDYIDHNDLKYAFLGFGLKNDKFNTILNRSYESYREYEFMNMYGSIFDTMTTYVYDAEKLFGKEFKDCLFVMYATNFYINRNIFIKNVVIENDSFFTFDEHDNLVNYMGCILPKEEVYLKYNVQDISKDYFVDDEYTENIVNKVISGDIKLLKLHERKDIVAYMNESTKKKYEGYFMVLSNRDTYMITHDQVRKIIAALPDIEVRVFDDITKGEQI